MTPKISLKNENEQFACLPLSMRMLSSAAINTHVDVSWNTNHLLQLLSGMSVDDKGQKVRKTLMLKVGKLSERASEITQCVQRTDGPLYYDGKISSEYVYEAHISHREARRTR